MELITTTTKRNGKCRVTRHYFITTIRTTPEGLCQAPSKTEPEATRKLSHLEAEEGGAATAGQGPLVLAETDTPMPSTG
ncbi:MAG: hypothetical protein ACK5N0_15450, partial [Synechococcaceae cyanobacterium]